MIVSANLAQAIVVTPPPVITTDLTDDALVITATGEGTVTLYVQIIDNETGAMTNETYEAKALLAQLFSVMRRRLITSITGL